VPIAASLLAACGGVPAPPAANVQPQVAASVIAERPTATNMPPTATPVPSATALPTPTDEPTATPTDLPTATPRPDVSLVSGENSFARGAIGQRPWMVMIDNHPDAYPQSGMDHAAMVFEGLAEFGITRFIALYVDGATPDVGEIGPVRSTRLYFAQWAMGFHPVYAHAGGSPDGVQLAESTDQFINFEALRQPSYTWRDQQRLAPHNLYTKSALLRAFAADKNVSGLDDPAQGYLFQQIEPGATDATQIDYFFLDRSSRAGFTYDPASNGYYRTMRGGAHIDRISGEQLWTRNVVVMEVAEAARAGDEKQRIDQEVVGTGAARVFLAGRTIEGSWRKETADGPLRFYDANGDEVVFNLGPIWVAAIPTLERLTTQ
jgi:hypothetical protein